MTMMECNDNILPLEEQTCPCCSTSKRFDSEFVLWVTSCGHSLCRKCLDIKFPSDEGQCPSCSSKVLKKNCRVQFFDDPFIEREVHIRRKLRKDYNLREDSFATIDEYDDYLEEFEDMVYKLARKIDVESLKMKIQQHKLNNRQLILENRGKLDADEERMNRLIEDEKLKKKLEEIRKKEELKEKRAVQKKKQEFIQKMAESGSVDNVLLEQLMSKAKKRKMDEDSENVNEECVEICAKIRRIASKKRSIIIKPFTKDILLGIRLPPKSTHFKNVVGDVQGGASNPENAPARLKRRINKLYPEATTAGGYSHSLHCVQTLATSFNYLRLPKYKRIRKKMKYIASRKRKATSRIVVKSDVKKKVEKEVTE